MCSLESLHYAVINLTIHHIEYFKSLEALKHLAFFLTTVTQCEDGKLSFEVCAPSYTENGLSLDRLHN